MSPLAVLRRRDQHLWVKVLGPACFGLASPRTPLGWELGLWIQYPLALRGTWGQSQLLLACLDAGVGLLVQWDIAALPRVQVEQRVFHNLQVKALLPQLHLL